MEDNKILQTQTDWYFNKNTEHYNDSTYNYVIPKELTVTITLAEYRSLLTSEAEGRAHKLKNELWETQHNLKEADNQIAMLKNMLNAKEEKE